MRLRHKYILILVAILLPFALILSLWSNIAADLFIIKAAPGVTLEQLEVGDCSREEIVTIVAELAKINQRAAINAEIDQKTHSLIPELYGYCIDQEDTVTKVLQAPANQTLSLTKNYYPPEITSELYPQAVISRGLPQKQAVSLLINVDWGLPEPLLSFLQVLREHELHVTFCMTGRVIDNYPETVSAIINNGHEIASHGYYHHSTSHNYYTMSVEDIQQELTATAEALAKVTSQEMQLFSPPSGILTDNIREAAAASGYRIILWTPGLDTIDWQEPAPEVIVERIKRGLVSGGIILMHPKEQSLEALPAIIKHIKEQGLSIVPVSQLISPYLITDYQYLREVNAPCE